MNARPLFENVLVKPIEKKKETKSGILLPASSKQDDEPIEGIVVSIGGGSPLPVAIQGIGGMTTLAHKPVAVKVGEHVVFKQYSGTPIKLDGQRHYLLTQQEILAVIDYEKTS